MELSLFRGVVPFLAVAEARSFRRAAVRLGISAAAVSKAVRSLEERLGQPLFSRTSRVVALTAEGQLYFERARVAASSLGGAREVLEARRAEPQGNLVLSAPFVAVPLLTPALGMLRERYPRLHLELKVSDALAQLGEDAVDVAVRIGTLRAWSLVARRLRATRMLTVASPAYLARMGTPRTREDLMRHDCLVLRSPEQKPRPWLFSSGPFRVAAAFTVDHGPTLVDGATAGLGITQAFDFMVEQPLARGHLVRVLPDLTAEGPDVHVVCVPGRRANANVRAAFDTLADAFSLADTTPARKRRN